MATADDQAERRGAAASALGMLGVCELIVAGAAFVVVCVVVSANSLLRFGFNSSLVWSEEVALLATNVFVYLGAAVILKANADVSVSFLVNKLRPRTRTLVRLAIYTAAALFFATLLWQSIALWPLQQTTSTYILDISRYWFTLPLVWAAASMLLTSAVFVLDIAADLAQGRTPGPYRYLALPAEPE